MTAELPLHHVLTTVTDWWCPDEQRWVMCPGPCPDGTAHDLTRQKQVPMRLGPVDHWPSRRPSASGT